MYYLCVFWLFCSNIIFSNIIFDQKLSPNCCVCWLLGSLVYMSCCVTLCVFNVSIFHLFALKSLFEGHFSTNFIIGQDYCVKYQKNLAHRAKSMKFCMKVPKTKEKILIRRASKNYIVWRHNDVINEKLDVIMTSLRRQMYKFCLRS